MAHTVYELDVRLREIEPPIWRTIEVPGVSSLEDVHFAIQVAMGWTNSHLHQFVIGETRYGMADVDEDLELEDERRFRLQDLVRTGQGFVYEYDFGDGWEHEVTIRKVATQAKPPKPRCTGGARACPPDDCGGYGGYANLLEALADPNHEEHESSVSWSGNFQPERFAIPKTGLDLRTSMNELDVMAAGDDADNEYDALDLPTPLVEAVLALEPMQRASLSALIAGSLASELVEVRTVSGQLVEELKKQRKPARHVRNAPGRRTRTGRGAG
jgi:hypothetical protein